MWTVVYIEQNEQIAENVRLMLEKNSIITKVRSVKNVESTDECYEVLVPESELQQSLSLIIDASF